MLQSHAPMWTLVDCECIIEQPLEDVSRIPTEMKYIEINWDNNYWQNLKELLADVSYSLTYRYDLSA